MFDSRKELLDKIELGEDAFLEYKEVRFAGERMAAPRRDALADELAAFANSRGGVLVLGVEDSTSEVVGIHPGRLNSVERFVHEVCNDSVEPPLFPTIERVRLPTSSGEDVAVIKIEVPTSLFVHRSPGGYLRRVGSTRRVMPTEYLQRVFEQRSKVRLTGFDERTVFDAELDDLDRDLWERFKSPRSDGDREQFLTKVGLAHRDEGGVARPTVAGVLLATRDPRSWLRNAYVQAVAYRGDAIRPDMAGAPYQLDAADITGPLDAQIEGAVRFVAKNMRVFAYKDLGRRDSPSFDMTAVFEAVVNAVAHRDYSLYGTKVRIRLFENRLEIHSPGTIPNSMTVERLAYVQSARNDVIMSLLARCPVPENVPWLNTDRRTLTDRRGEGVSLILENSERLSGKRPEYLLLGDAELMLTVHASEA